MPKVGGHESATACDHRGSIDKCEIPGIYQYTVSIQHHLFMGMVAWKKAIQLFQVGPLAGANGAKVLVPLMFTCSSPCTAIPTLSFGSGAKLSASRLPNVVSLVHWVVRTAPCYIPFISR